MDCSQKQNDVVDDFWESIKNSVGIQGFTYQVLNIFFFSHLIYAKPQVSLFLLLVYFQNVFCNGLSIAIVMDPLFYSCIGAGSKALLL